MTDADQSTATAQGPYRQEGESKSNPARNHKNRDIGLFHKLKSALAFRSATLRDDLEDALDDAESQQGDNSLSVGERVMLRNVLNMGQVRVVDVMVPRADIEAVEQSETVDALLQTFRKAGHSRLPIYHDTLDDIKGMVHVKDLMHLLTLPATSSVKGTNTIPVNGAGSSLRDDMLEKQLSEQESLLRRVLFVPPSMMVSNLLQSMQATRNHMAIVIDEYGGTDGVVTIEDLLETVVGDIEDEHDDNPDDLIQTVSENLFLVDAKADLQELQEIIGTDFNIGEYLEDVETLGGLIFSLADRIPVRGELIKFRTNFEFEIVDADPRRIKTIKIRRRRKITRAMVAK